MLLSIIFTFSRGAFFVLGIITIAALIYRRPRPAEIAVYILVAAIGLSFVPSHYIARLATISDLSGGTTAIRSEVSFRGRASELLAAWQMFIDHPILGVGAHNYPAYYQEYSRHIGLDPRSEARQPHNLFLEVAAETGIIGLIVFGLILFFSYRSLWQSWKTSHTSGQKQTADLIASFAFALTAYLLTSFFIHAAYPRFFWLLVGLALAMPQVVRSQIEHLTIPGLKSGERNESQR